MKKTYSLLLLLFLALNSAFVTANTSKTKVLMLISGCGNETRPELSYDLEELAQSYLVLHDNGVELDIATPKGGAVLVKTNKDDLAYIQRFKSIALKQLKNTKATKDISASDYDGVFIVGGAGAMFDLPSDNATQAVLTDFAAQQHIIAAVCHGPAAIADVKLPNGKFLIEGKKVNGFTNIEEHAFSGEHISMFPFLVQDKLTQNGGVFVSNDPMLPFVAVDKNLITAQNPSSVPNAAEAMLLKLGVTPKTREPFADEATMELIAEAKNNGTVAIDLALSKKPQMYDLNYLALYGFYAYALAPDSRKKVELDLMEAISQHFQHPAYEAALIKALVEQERNLAANQALATFLTRYPSHEDVSALTALVNPSQPHS